MNGFFLLRLSVCIADIRDFFQAARPQAHVAACLRNICAGNGDEVGAVLPFLFESATAAIFFCAVVDRINAANPQAFRSFITCVCTQ